MVIKRFLLSLFIALQTTAVSFAVHRPGHTQGGGGGGGKNKVPEIDGDELFVLLTLLAVIGLLFFHWYTARKQPENS